MPFCKSTQIFNSDEYNVISSQGQIGQNLKMYPKKEEFSSE